ncbi:MAG TPA: hypothetical protein DCS24_00715 [Erythrobacter sp.]|nr:hypothetical protein [Erythrobacter sp.]
MLARPLRSNGSERSISALVITTTSEAPSAIWVAKPTDLSELFSATEGTIPEPSTSWAMAAGETDTASVSASGRATILLSLVMVLPLEWDHLVDLGLRLAQSSIKNSTRGI